MPELSILITYTPTPTVFKPILTIPYSSSQSCLDSKNVEHSALPTIKLYYFPQFKCVICHKIFNIMHKKSAVT